MEKVLVEVYIPTLKTAYTKAEKDIYICRVAIPGASTAIAGLDFIVKGEVSASGQVEIKVTLGNTKGFEYKNGNVRYINDSTRGLEVAAEAECEITLGVGVELAILTYNAASLTLDAGVGGSFGLTTHLVDEAFHLIFTGKGSMPADSVDLVEGSSLLTASEDILALAEASGATWKEFEAGAAVSLHPKVCIDWKIYPILRLKLKINPIDFSASKEFSGSKNTKFILKGHIHFPSNFTSAFSAGSIGEGFARSIGLGESCSYKFTPWDETEETTAPTITDETVEATGNEDTILTTNGIVVSSYRLFVDKGMTASFSIKGLPEGYSYSDLTVKTEDSSIATVDLNTGIVKANEKAGTTQIEISTSDGKHKAYIAVTVNEGNPDDFVGLTITGEFV